MGYTVTLVAFAVLFVGVVVGVVVALFAIVGAVLLRRRSRLSREPGTVVPRP